MANCDALHILNVEDSDVDDQIILEMRVEERQSLLEGMD